MVSSRMTAVAVARRGRPPVPAPGPTSSSFTRIRIRSTADSHKGRSARSGMQGSGKEGTDMNGHRLTGKRQQGIAALEFLLTAPFLLLVVIAVSELGWAFHQYHTMTRAARDGARHLASHAINNSMGFIFLSSAVVQEASNLVVYGNTLGAGDPLLPGWSAGDISVSSPDPSHVTVNATYNYVPLVGQIPAFYGGEPVSMAFSMQSTVQMRAL
ncbi:hypothetical protein CLH61_01550 [Marinobacter profundi]|uniref:TadE-like domain-containing protein n=2 Tax=Marinobacteraceae TaxID=2887365 RepID=A0A2G1UQN3_9GAMM|nr:hypothetical protein CLH61_01550 [Marinobacter profundi]